MNVICTRRKDVPKLRSRLTVLLAAGGMANSQRGKVSDRMRLRLDRVRLHEPAQMAVYTLSHRLVALDRSSPNSTPRRAARHHRCPPTLTAQRGVGVGHVAQFLVATGQNIGKMRREAAFARLCGVAPASVSSGKSLRMRLHRGGDRQSNRTLHMGLRLPRLRCPPAFGQVGDAVAAFAEERPHLLGRRSGPGKAGGHTDDGDVVKTFNAELSRRTGLK